MAKKSVETEIYVLMDVQGITAEMDEGVLLAVKKAAEILLKDAKTKYLATVGQDLKRNKRTGKVQYSQSTGLLGRKMFAWKAKYGKIGWLAGIPYKAGPVKPRTTNSGNTDWEYSLGGRAHFREYGRSAPGRGKLHGGPDPVGKRAQKKKPFMRPARNRMKRALGGITGMELRRAARKMNRDPQLNRQVMSVVNRVS
jgi:hypothetical protein